MVGSHPIVVFVAAYFGLGLLAGSVYIDRQWKTGRPTSRQLDAEWLAVVVGWPGLGGVWAWCWLTLRFEPWLLRSAWPWVRSRFYFAGLWAAVSWAVAVEAVRSYRRLLK